MYNIPRPWWWICSDWKLRAKADIMTVAASHLLLSNRLNFSLCSINHPSPPFREEISDQKLWQANDLGSVHGHATEHRKGAAAKVKWKILGSYGWIGPERRRKSWMPTDFPILCSSNPNSIMGIVEKSDQRIGKPLKSNFRACSLKFPSTIQSTTVEADCFENQLLETKPC